MAVGVERAKPLLIVRPAEFNDSNFPRCGSVITASGSFCPLRLARMLSSPSQARARVGWVLRSLT